MGIFNKDSEITNSSIKNRTITRKYNICKEICSITLHEAKFAEIDGCEKLLDESLINNTFGEIVSVIKRNCSKYNPVPKSIIISNNENQIDNGSGNKDIINDDFISCYSPKWVMDDIYLESSSKRQIMSVLSISKNKEKLFNEWGLGSCFKNERPLIFNFYGQPGTGKSIAAEAIASYLNKKVCSVNYSQLESKYVGETPKNIKKVFEIASKNNAVIIFDEADSFLGKRITNVTQSADYGVNITRSVMLLELENFDGIVIFTTNLLSNYDDAFKRRILASIEFKLPDKDGREMIWRTHIPKKLPLSYDITVKYLAERYENISGADIKDILLNASILCIQRNADALNSEDFDLAYKFVVNRYKSENNFKIENEVITAEQYEKEIKNAKNEATKAGEWNC